MSARCVGWAFALQVERSRRGRPLQPSAHHVLLCLADRFNGKYDCAWPSQADIIARTGLSERGVRNALDELERLGIIKRKPRLNEKHRKIGTIYLFPLYSDVDANERIGYDFDRDTGQYDEDLARENQAEMGDRFAGMFGAP